MATPWFFLGLFLAASFLMIWRLESMAAGGFEGTVLGTLVMPYCTGMGNLIFAIVLGAQRGSGAAVLTNCLVNNVTNFTLLVGLPVALWGMSASAAGKTKKTNEPDYTHHLDRLSTLLTLMAVLFFTGVTWAIGRRGQIGFVDGLLLVGLFLFWQSFHLFEVIKTNARKNRSFTRGLALDLVLLALCSWAIYLSTNWLVTWVSGIKSGFISARYLGWLSGCLDVLPNGLLAFYYGWKRQPEVVYASQVGDGHVCIPLCIGVFALFKPISVTPFFETGILILGAATIVHLLCIGLVGRLPRLVGWLLSAAYLLFLYEGLLKKAG
ncbi:MAG TPA: sodium:calcium symporter [Verrucomicrobiae bacterium]|jgi:cation:H+ antiporter|nr:sodium:calcium symporter [Verrucomicrobiae bacterium]